MSFKCINYKYNRDIDSNRFFVLISEMKRPQDAIKVSLEYKLPCGNNSRENLIFLRQHMYYKDLRLLSMLFSPLSFTSTSDRQYNHFPCSRYLPYGPRLHSHLQSQISSLEEEYISTFRLNLFLSGSFDAQITYTRILI